MQLQERVKNCNGCAACVGGCKSVCVKMKDLEEGRIKREPIIDENGCSRCNACFLFCPLFNPVELPEFEEFYEYSEAFEGRDMPKLYRETMRNVKAGQQVEFVGTLCEIAALKSLSGDKIRPNLTLKPLYCDDEKRAKDPACAVCTFYQED